MVGRAPAPSAPMSAPGRPKMEILPSIFAAGGAGAGVAAGGAGVESLKPVLRAKIRGSRMTKADKIAEKLARQKHRISSAVAALVEAEATKSEVAKYFRMRVEELSYDGSSSDSD